MTEKSLNKGLQKRKNYVSLHRKKLIWGISSLG